MNGYDLMCDWPSLKALSPQEILAFPAWYDTLEYDGEPQRVTVVPRPEENPLPIEVTVDGASQVVLLWDSESYPDLHRLWPRLAGLPREIVLALVEKECDNALHLLEQLAGGVLQIVRVADAVPEGAWTCFRVEAPGGELRVGLIPSSAAIAELGTIGHLDPDHESVRSLVRTARPVYAELDLDEEGVAALKSGDCLIPPEGFPGDGEWLYDLPDDGRLRIVGKTPQEISFGAYADEDFPPPPETPDCVLYRGKVLCGSCSVRTLGDVTGVCLNSDWPSKEE